MEREAEKATAATLSPLLLLGLNLSRADILTSAPGRAVGMEGWKIMRQHHCRRQAGKAAGDTSGWLQAE